MTINRSSRACARRMASATSTTTWPRRASSRSGSTKPNGGSGSCSRQVGREVRPVTEGGARNLSISCTVFQTTARSKPEDYPIGVSAWPCGTASHLTGACSSPPRSDDAWLTVPGRLEPSPRPRRPVRRSLLVPIAHRYGRFRLRDRDCRGRGRPFWLVLLRLLQLAAASLLTLRHCNPPRLPNGHAG